MPDTVIRRHHMLTMRLDLSCVDVAYLQALTQRLEDFRVVPSTLSQEQIVNPEAVRQAYLCHNECRKRQPPVELRQEPLPFDRWFTTCFEGIDAAPDLYFLAMHRQKYIGVCMFERNPRSPDLLITGFTGVLPAWTGRGVAKALKAHGLLCAIQCGFRYVETNNLVVNQGMCAINRSLGFQVVRRRLISYPIPIADSEQHQMVDAAPII